MIDVWRLLYYSGVHTYNPFGSEGYLRLAQQGAATVLQFDRDGAAGTVHGFASVATLSGVSVASLTDANFAGEFKLSGDPVGVIRDGTAGDDRLDGTSLRDTLRGGAGNDILYGHESEDLLDGGSGDDKLGGGSERDYLYGGAGRDALDGEWGDDFLDGGDGDDRLLDRSGDNTMLGGAGEDYLESWGQGRNLLDGGEGHDRLLSRFGNDTLLGGNGHDVVEMDNSTFAYPYPIPTQPMAHLVVLDAGDGNDIVRTRFTGADTSVRASGGGGVDTFELHGVAGAGKYVITDFTVGAGGDVLDLMTFIPRYGAHLNPFAPAANSMRLVQQGADLVLQYNTAAATETASFKELVTLKGVSAASLTAANFVGGMAPDGASGDLSLAGGAGNDVLTGAMFNDTLDGGAGNDTLSGERGNDILRGGDGNDLLAGGFGKNELNGGAGLDTASYEYGRWAFDAIRVDGKLVIMNTGIVGSPVHRHDTWDSIERAKFGTESWAFDVDGAGGQVYRLYEAAFNRAPDKIGVGFWMTMVDRGTLSLAQVSEEFVKSPEFASLYGASPTNTELVTRFYQNMLDREPDAVGKAFWIRMLDEKLATVATVLSHFSESPENQANLASIIGNGFEYIPYGA